MKLASVSHEENILCIFPRFSSRSPAKLEVHHCSASKKISGTAVRHAKIESTTRSSLALSRSHKLEDIRRALRGWTFSILLARQGETGVTRASSFMSPR